MYSLPLWPGKSHTCALYLGFTIYEMGPLPRALTHSFVARHTVHSYRFSRCFGALWCFDDSSFRTKALLPSAACQSIGSDDGSELWPSPGASCSWGKLPFPRLHFLHRSSPHPTSVLMREQRLVPTSQFWTSWSPSHLRSSSIKWETALQSRFPLCPSLHPLRCTENLHRFSPWGLFLSNFCV